MSDSTRTTVYLSPNVRKALKRRIVETDQTMSEYVDEAVAKAIAEDLEDIKAIEERLGGATESLEEFLEALHEDGLL